MRRINPEGYGAGMFRLGTLLEPAETGMSVYRRSSDVDYYDGETAGAA